MVRVKGGTKKKMVNQLVIDYKDDVLTRAFPIGHRKQSETFLPNIEAFPDKEGTYIVDMAGLKDKDGHLIEITNSFINKKLFN